MNTVLSGGRGPGHHGGARYFNKAELEATRARIEEARHLPGIYYTSPEIYAMEVEKLFMHDWLVVARVEEIPSPGDYMTMDIVGEPIIVCRNADGTLHAFSNVCRHRGAAVASGAGNAKEFTCPFHGWIYSLDGRLVSPSQPRGLPRFDVKSCRLSPIKLATWGGFVFVNFDDACPTLADYLGVDEFAESAAFIRPEDMVLVDRFTYEIDCNWKLLPENLIDTYHVEVIHKGSFATEGFGERSLRDVIFTKWGWRKVYPSRSMSPDGEMLFGPTPWLADHELGPAFAYSAFLRPNFNFLVRADMLQPWVTYPLGPERSRVTGFTCLWKGVEEMPAFRQKVEILKDFARRFAGEDMELLQHTQKGLRARRFTGGPMHYQEAAIHHRINRYLDAMEGDGDVR